MAHPPPNLTLEQVAGLLDSVAQSIRAEPRGIARSKQLLTNVQSYAWPNLGNAQRFSEIE